MLAFDALQNIDPGFATKVKAIAPNAVAGTPEAKAAMNQVGQDMDFDSSDGTPADTFAGKSLDHGQGGRAAYYRTMRMVGDGMTESQANAAGIEHFNTLVSGMEGLDGNTIGEKVVSYRLKYPIPA